MQVGDYNVIFLSTCIGIHNLDSQSVKSTSENKTGTMDRQEEWLQNRLPRLSLSGCIRAEVVKYQRRSLVTVQDYM